MRCDIPCDKDCQSPCHAVHANTPHKGHPDFWCQLDYNVREVFNHSTRAYYRDKVQNTYLCEICGSIDHDTLGHGSK